MHFESMLQQAANLLSAADRLLVEEPADSGMHEAFPLEALVLTALGAEIALKAAICCARSIDNPADLKALVRTTAKAKHVSAHDLSVLFRLLSAQEQEALRKNVLSAIPHEQIFTAVMNRDERWEPRSVRFDFRSGSTFEAELSAVRLCFEELRYTYEPSMRIINRTFLRCFAESTIDLVSRALAIETSSLPHDPS